MAANSPVTQKELAEVNKELKELREEFKVVYKMIGGLREEIEKQIKSLQSMDMETAKVVGDHGVAIKDLEQHIKKVEKDNWI
jgi:septal ring factor EnvC (AmiA/AmiB activator)